MICQKLSKIFLWTIFVVPPSHVHIVNMLQSLKVTYLYVGHSQRVIHVFLSSVSPLIESWRDDHTVVTRALAVCKLMTVQRLKEECTCLILS